ncbi:MAG: ABC transporter ATP-binding protein [Myxococcota bacterium]
MMDLGFDLAGKSEPRLKTGFVLASAGAIAEAGPLLVAFFVVDRLLAGQDSPLSLGMIVGSMLVLLVAAFGLKYVGGRLNFSATYDLVCETRLRLTEHLRRLPMGFWSKRRMGSTASVLTDEFSLYTEIVTHAWSLIVANVALPGAIGIVLLLSDWRLGLIALAPVPLALLAIPWSFRLINRAADGARVEKQAAVDLMVEYVQGIESLRALDADADYRRRIEARLVTLEEQMMRAELLPAPAIFTYSLVVFSGFVAVFGVGSMWLSAESLPAARFFVVTVVALHFVRTLSDLVVYLAMSRHAARTLERMRELFEVPEQPEGQGTVRADHPTIEVEGMSFAYEDQPTLRGVNATFERGTVTALVGPSGSGKSTLAHLLTRLWDVDEGRVTLDGVDLRALPLETVHANTATVFQDVVLFADTVLENIRLGRPDATRQQVEAAARAARAHGFIEALPEGYDTVLDPGGRNLSGGQRQRISIARALIKDAPVLILDEATASVDLDEERQIQEAIGALMEGRTVIVVAHRLWTIQHADQILVLDRGQIVEQGTHGALLRHEGLYRHLWDLQMDNRDWGIGRDPALMPV